MMNTDGELKIAEEYNKRGTHTHERSPLDL